MAIDPIAYLRKPTHLAPLAFLRVAFGVLMFSALLRSLLKGWVYELYIQPEFHFTYYGFSWVKPLGVWTYALWGVAMLSALAVAVGYKYRWAIITFTLTFTYIELMDVAYYLNHYYFITVLAFALCWLPAERYGSLDAYLGRVTTSSYAPQWTLALPRILVSVLYFYAGMAKMNSDWLLEAQPLKMWLPSSNDLPIIGAIADEPWLPYFFAWAGMIYDSTVWLFLWWKKSRIYAYITVVIFHLLTSLFFPAIGVFPFVMMVITLVFFNAPFQRVLGKVWKAAPEKNVATLRWNPPFSRIILPVFVALQIVFPLRSLAYPGELFWTEEGFRFSWRVMLMEKSGAAEFKIVQPSTGKYIWVEPKDFLNRTQEKQMCFQPDLILQFAHYLGEKYRIDSTELEVYIHSAVTLNARPAQPIINEDVNLMKWEDSWDSKPWITPWKSEIYGW